MFPNSVVPLPSNPGLTTQGFVVSAAEPKDRAETMQLHFSLTPAEDRLQELEDRVANGEVIPIDEQEKKYGADAAASADALVAWLKSEGFKVSHVTPDHTTVYASAPVSQVEASLGVHTVHVTRDGQTYTAASDAPSLPTAVAGAVFHIGGLQPFLHAQKHSRFSQIRPPDGAEEEAGPAIANAPPYLVSEILKAYDANGLNLSGAGQEIAILIDTFPLDGDMTAFWQLNNVNIDLGRITKINVNGGTVPQPSGEETLDAEWTSGIAPRAGIRTMPVVHCNLPLSTALSIGSSPTPHSGPGCGRCRSAWASVRPISRGPRERSQRDYSTRAAEGEVGTRSATRAWMRDRARRRPA
jgi:kumamolisin